MKKNFPEAEVDVACMFSGVEYVFNHNEKINKIYRLSLYSGNKWQGFKQLLSLRKEKYNISILAFPCYRREYNFVHWLVGAKKRIAHKFNKGFYREFHFLNTDLVEVDESDHNVINNLNLLKPLGINWQDRFKKEDLHYVLKLNQKDIDFGKDYIKQLSWENEKIIAIHPGSTNSPAALLRRWPIERYAAVAKFLIKDKKSRILIFAGSDEKELGQELNMLINDNIDCKLVTGTNFGQSLGILNYINLLICNENGFSHLAVALGKKTIMLEASTNPVWSAPFDSNLLTVIRPDNFKPWYRYDLKRTVPVGAEGGIDKITIKDVLILLNER
ncbi:MAG: glycosyltransferase family 9 protein [Patescibacteria group bacterium]